MKNPRLSIGRVNIRMRGGSWTAQQAERMSRMMVRHLHEGLVGLTSVNGQGVVAPRPVSITRGTSIEETARKAAAEIARALRKG